MAIFKVNKEKNFTVVSNHILRNKEASLKAKGLLVWMLSCDEKWNFSLAGMQACLKEKEDAIVSTLKELETLGYLTRIKLMPETNKETGEVIRSRVEWVYNIYEEPQILPTDFQCVETQSTETQSTENQLQRNTNNKELLKDKEIPKYKKAPEPVPSEIKSSKRNFRRETEPLKDVLESGADIKKQVDSQKKRKTTKEKCLDEIDETKYGFTDGEKEVLREYLEWAVSGRDNRRIKNVDLWRNKLNTLIQLRDDGEDITKVVQNSLEKKWYVFVEEKQNHSNSSSHYVQKVDRIVNTKSNFNSKEEVEAELKRRVEVGIPSFK